MVQDLLLTQLLLFEAMSVLLGMVFVLLIYLALSLSLVAVLSLSWFLVAVLLLLEG